MTRMNEHKKNFKTTCGGMEQGIVFPRYLTNKQILIIIMCKNLNTK